MMIPIYMSNDISEVAAALVAVQSEMGTVAKEAENPFFRSKYADLASVYKMATPILTKYGLCVSQLCVPSNTAMKVVAEKNKNGTETVTETKGVKIVTLLMHKSGQYIGSELEMFPTKDDPQGIGSAITYARRYAYMAIIGLVAEEDDDGNAASAPPARFVKTEKPKPKPKTNTVKDQLAELYAEYVKAGLTKNQIQERWQKMTGKASSAEMTEEDVKLLKMDITTIKATGEVPEVVVAQEVTV